MNEDEFNRLLNELINGMPFPLIVTRLGLALVTVIEAGGEPAAQAFRQYCQQRDQENEG